MELMACLVLGFAAYLLSGKYFYAKTLHPYIDSLRQGKFLFLFVGIGAGVLFPENEETFRVLDQIRYALINIGLIWVGFEVGLECNLRQIRQSRSVIIGGQVLSAVLIAGFAIVSILASGTVLFRHLGLASNLSLATGLCTCFVLTSRFPEPTLLWHKRFTSPSADPTPTLPVHNILALLLLTISISTLGPTTSITLANLSLVGSLQLLGLIIFLGLTAGCCLDFALRSHRKPASGMATACCVLIFFGGVGSTLNLPPMSLGFIAGVWLINATLTKRGLLEAITRVSNAFIPLFFFFIGTLLGGFGGGAFSKLYPIFPLIAMVLVVRSMGRTLGYSLLQYLLGVPATWRDTLELSARPLGTVSVALAVQSLFFLDLTHKTLIAGLLGAVVVSQVLLFPPQKKDTKPTVATLQKD